MKAGEPPTLDATVVIRDGRIESVVPAGTARIPPGALRVAGKGKWLMPALADSHVHVENDRILRLLADDPGILDGTVEDADIFTPYILSGILQISNLAAMSEAVGQRSNVESGRVLGPHMALAAMIDGEPPLWPSGVTRVAATPADGRQAVRDAKHEGYDQIKTYSMLTLETFTAIVDEARLQQMKVVGHIAESARDQLEDFFLPGFGMVAHAEEFAFASDAMSDEDIERFVALAKRSGTSLTSTLTVDERILEQMRSPDSLLTRPELRLVHPTLLRTWRERNRYIESATAERIAELQRVIEFNQKLVAAFIAAGIAVLPGTDALVSGVVPGESLHDELEALARAGMPNQQILEAATRGAAEWLGVADDRGTLEPGKRADLLLLDADPRQDVANTRRIAALIAGDRYLSRRDLAALEQRLVERYAAMQP
jgi:imidazolonepropionase-like amidohydrolase